MKSKKEGIEGAAVKLSAQKAQVITRIKEYIVQHPYQMPRDSILEWLKDRTNLQAARILGRFDEEEQKPVQNKLYIWVYEYRANFRASRKSVPDSIVVLKKLCGSNPLYQEDIDDAMKALSTPPLAQSVSPSAPPREAVMNGETADESDAPDNQEVVIEGAPYLHN